MMPAVSTTRSEINGEDLLHNGRYMYVRIGALCLRAGKINTLPKRKFGGWKKKLLSQLLFIEL